MFNWCVFNYQLQEPLTYVAAQLLLYECVKMLDSEQSFLKKVSNRLLSLYSYPFQHAPNHLTDLRYKLYHFNTDILTCMGITVSYIHKENSYIAL